MKYLTKEWKQTQMVIHLYEQLRISRKAEKKNKSLFEEINRRIELCRTLPKEILNEIENIRLFSLGATTKEIREKVKAYCREQRREAVKTEKLAQRKTEQVEGILKLPIEFALYKERPILKMEQKGSDLYIELDDLPKLIIRNITFIEREKEYYYKWNENEYACPWTYVLESELHFIKGRYEVHFLLETRHKSGKTENWYYTVSGTNIEIEEEYRNIRSMESVHGNIDNPGEPS